MARNNEMNEALLNHFEDTAPIDEEGVQSQAEPEVINIFAGTDEHAELSNFAIRPFSVNVNKVSVRFDSVEQAFAYIKTLYSSAPQSALNEIRSNIMREQYGPELRRLGRSIPDLNIPMWDRDAENVMMRCVYQSFKQNPAAMEALLATGDAQFTHTQDVTRWRELFPALLMRVRDSLRGEESAEQKEKPALAPLMTDAFLLEKASQYDLLSLGTGKRDHDAFMSLIPEGTTVVVDTRNYPRNTQRPWFNASSLSLELKERGINYVPMKSLSGALKKNDRREWAQLAETEAFQSELKSLAQLVAGGQKVVFISGDGNPEYGNRALLVSQELEAKYGLSVGHIDTRNDGAARIRSQADIVRRVVAGVDHFEGGSHINVHFNSKREYTIDEGVKAVKKQMGASAEDRLIEGKWNYGQKVEINQMEGDNSKSQKAAIVNNVDYSDVTVVFSVGTYDTTIGYAKKAAQNSCVCVNVNGKVDGVDENGEPTTTHLPLKDVLNDPSYAAGVAEKIRDKINRIVVKNSEVWGGDSIDLQNLKVNIVGSDISHIVNKRIDSMNQDEVERFLTSTEFSREESMGLHIEDVEVNEQDVQRFMTSVIEQLQNPSQKESFDEELSVKTFNIGEIRTTGQSGVAEAAVIAAQSLGIKASIVSPTGFPVTIDNETMQGRTVYDEALMKNRFHRGLKHLVSMENLRQKVEYMNYLREKSDTGFSAGLTDMQILTLRKLGFSNTDIVDMAALASSENAYLHSDADLADFITMSAGNGIGASETYIDADAVAAAREQAQDAVRRAYENGTRFITVNSPEYPENYRRMHDELITVYDEKITVNKVDDARAREIIDGILRKEDIIAFTDHETGKVVVDIDGNDRRATSFSTEDIPEELLEDGTVIVDRIPRTVVEKRPAILWLTGNEKLLSKASVSMVGGYAEVNDEGRSERLLKEIAADEPQEVRDVRNAKVAMARSLGEACAENDVAAIAVAGSNTASLAAGECADRGGSAILVSPDSFTGPTMQDLKNRIVAGDGLVISEKEPGDDTVAAADVKRAGKSMTALGYVAAFIDGAINAKALSPFDMAAYALYGSFAMTYMTVKGVAKLVDLLGGNENVKAATIGEVGGITEMAKANSGADADEPVEEAESEDLSEQTGQTITEEHPHQLPINVISYAGRRIYAVDAKYVDVRAAVLQQDPKAEFISYRERRRTYEELASRTEIIDGERVDAFTGYRGTQPQEREPNISFMYYVDGSIHTLKSAPSYTEGLVTPRIRARNMALFAQLKKDARQMQIDMQKAAGLSTERAFRFETADYIVIKDNSIEVRRGHDFRAKITLCDTGEILVSNGVGLSDDLQEHAKRQFPVFTKGVRITDDVSLANAEKELHNALFSLSESEAQYLTPKDREDESRIQKEIEDGFLVPRKDNITVMMDDIRVSQEEGIISSGDGETISKAEAMGYLVREIKYQEKIQNNCRKEIATLEKALNSDSLSESEIEEVSDKLESVREDNLRAAARIRYIRSHTYDVIVFGDCRMSNVARKQADGSTVSRKMLDIDGLLINIANVSKLTDKQLAAGREKLESMTKTLDSYKKAMESRQETSQKQDSAVKVSSDDVISKTSADMFIVKLPDGSLAFADADLTVVGQPYTKLKPLSEKCYVALDGNAKYSLLYPDGQLIFKNTFDALSKPHENVCIVKVNGRYNHVNTATGEILSRQWFHQAGNFKDGWSCVQDKDGKRNFINAEGKLITKNWFDSATEFANGQATVLRDGNVCVINDAGKILEVKSRSQQQGIGVIND